MSDSENSQEPVFRPIGNGKWLIPPEVTKAIPEFRGEIVCTTERYKHIEEDEGDRKGHREEIRRKGYADAVEFVADTLAHVSAVYEATKKQQRGYDLVANVRPRSGTSLNLVIVRLRGFPERRFYSVRTAYIVKARTYKNKRPLWVHTPNAHSGPSRI